MESDVSGNAEAPRLPPLSSSLFLSLPLFLFLFLVFSRSLSLPPLRRWPIRVSRKIKLRSSVRDKVNLWILNMHLLRTIAVPYLSVCIPYSVPIAPCSSSMLCT